MCAQYLLEANMIVWQAPNPTGCFYTASRFFGRKAYYCGLPLEGFKCNTKIGGHTANRVSARLTEDDGDRPSPQLTLVRLHLRHECLWVEVLGLTLLSWPRFICSSFSPSLFSISAGSPPASPANALFFKLPRPVHLSLLRCSMLMLGTRQRRLQVHLRGQRHTVSQP